ncbi:uncharacterized protein LOC141622771 [Silene latifolia]|uniref:uncharacterized protein LOC141622771 n=1 Tax=Silene latifolia TaxID=37657 RepID=UPI003D77BD12
MACSSLNNIHSKEQHQKNSMNSNYISPRISFSNGFAESQSGIINLQSIDQYDHCPATSAGLDFEFSVATFDMNVADDLFFNGRLLPIVEDQKTLGVKNKGETTTLRDELLAGDDDDGDCRGSEDETGFRMRLPRLQKGNSSLGCKWRERLSSFKY